MMKIKKMLGLTKMGNSTGKLAKMQSPDSIVGISGILVIYALILFSISLWGYAILPSNCISQQVRESGRLCIIISCVMIVVYTSYAFCKGNCLLRVKGNKGQIFKPPEDYQISGGLLWFTALSSIVYIAFMSQFVKNLKDEQKCKGKGYDTWIMASTIANIVSAIGILVPLMIFIYRWRVESSEKESEKESQMSSMILSDPGDEQLED